MKNSGVYIIILYILIGAVSLVSAQNPGTVYEIAIKALENDRTDEALGLARSLIEDFSGTIEGKEALYITARAFENTGDIKSALSYYRQYLKVCSFSVHQQEARLKRRLIQQAIAQNDIVSLKLFLKALNSRDKGNYEEAMDTCLRLVKKFPKSHLADDALHLVAYIKLLELNAYSAAISAYEELIRIYPESSYINNAIYGQALALEKSGRFIKAKQKYQTLLELHTALKLPFSQTRLPKDNYLSRVWFKKVENRLKDLDERANIYQKGRDILAEKSFIFGIGGGFMIDQPAGSNKNYRNMWHLVTEKGFKPAYLTHWITRNHDWRWESKQTYQACIRFGFTPVISYWYFGDDISPEFVFANKKAYFNEIENNLIPLIRELPEVLILLEPEFNKNGIPEWDEWDSIMVRAINLIKQHAPNAKVGLVVGDWGEHEIKSSFQNIDKSVQLSDFVGFMEMVSSLTDRNTFDPTWSMIERSNRLVRHLRQRFKKPIYLGYLAISTAGDWEIRQADLINQFMANIPWYINHGVFGASFFALFDNPKQKGWFSEAEKHFGLITADGKIKKGGYAWQEGIRRIRDFDTRHPRLQGHLTLNHSEIDFLHNKYLIGKGRLSEWCRWRIIITGQRSNASYTIFGAGQEITFTWSGQSDKENFTDEECIITLEAIDQAGNGITSPPVLKFKIINMINQIPRLTVPVTRGQVLQAWKENSKIDFQDSDGARIVLQKLGGVDILLSFTDSAVAPASGADMSVKCQKKCLITRGIYSPSSSMLDRNARLDLTVFSTNCHIEITARFVSGFEGLALGLVDSKGFRSVLNLEAYINPDIPSGDTQKLLIPLSDFSILGHRYESDGKIVRQDISFNSIKKLIFTASVIPVNFSISSIRILEMSQTT